MNFRIQNNTDNRDIDAKSLGISAWVPGDSISDLNRDRGLHIQVRHGGHKDIYEAAIKLQRLITAAPDMLEALEDIANDSTAVSGLCERQVMMIRYAVQKAQGEK